ncbi:MAG: hypothetical protein ABH823_02730 [bacterium]
MKKILLIIGLAVFFLTFLVLLPKTKEYNWNFDLDDHLIMSSLHEEILSLGGNILFPKPLVTRKAFDGFSLTLNNNGREGLEIVSVCFNGLEVLPRTNIEHRPKFTKITFSAGHELRAGVHFFMVKYKDPQFRNQVTSATALLWIRDDRKRKTAETSMIDQRALEVIKELYKTQQKLKSFSARLTGHFEAYAPPNPPTTMDFTGRFQATGQNKFSINLTNRPTFSPKGQKPEINFPETLEIDRNHLGAFNLAFYLDYFGIMNTYNWDITFEDDKQIILRGLAHELSQKPYQYLISVDKKQWLPIGVQTFMDEDFVMGWANIKYNKIGNIYVPVKQVTTCKFSDGVVHEYTLDLSK